ncbi:MAG: ABC transporter permease [Phycisphaerales bacterium]|nr:ABC transporter permease [Phycisphaerales bacterium]
MLFWITIKSAIKSLWASKMRSLLAMLGIIIGVGAVIAMLALGAGTQAKVIADLDAMGTNLLTVRPAQRSSQGVMQGTQQNLTVEDALALVELPGVHMVTPVVGGSVQAKYFSHNTWTNLQGTAATYFEIRNFPIDKGRAFTEQEEELWSRVAVLGPTTATDLFGPNNPLGETIKINGSNYKVVGIMKAKGDQGWYNPDDQIIIPYTTAMKRLFGLTSLREINIAAHDGVDLSALSGQPEGSMGNRPGGYYHETPPGEETVAGLMRKRHKRWAGDPDDVRIMNQADLLVRRSQWVTNFRVLLGSIAAISLLVGGIGIMNIMLVTVTERTREIGTRKAIGAKGRDILLQFMVEALVMSGLGGGLGIFMGLFMAWGIPAVPWFEDFAQPLIQTRVMVLAVSVACGVGIFFGIYPAYRASKLDPIEALRYE